MKRTTKMVLTVVMLMAFIGTKSIAAPEAAGRKTYKQGQQLYVDSFDFRDVELTDVIETVSKMMRLNFAFDSSKVKNKVTIIGPKGMPVDAAYQAFLSALDIAGYTTVHEGSIIKIIQKRDAVHEAIPTYLSKSPFADPYMTRIINIQYIDVNEISKIVKGLISNEGTVTAYAPTQMLIITDSKANIAKVLRIIENLDVKGYQEKFALIQVLHGSAKEIVEKLEDIFHLSEGGRKGAPKDPNVVSDLESSAISKLIPYERNNSIIVLATKAGIEKVKEVIMKLDIPLGSGDSGGNFHVYNLENADAVEMAKTLSSITTGAGRPSGGRGGPESTVSFEGEIKIVADAATNALVIVASPSDYKILVGQIINRLDARRKQVFVESVIMEVAISSGYNVGGFAGNAAIGNKLTDFGTTFGATFGGFNSALNPNDPLTSSGLLVGFSSKDTATLDIPGGTDITVPVVGAILRAVGNNSNVNILSTPHILTTDNEEAVIQVGSSVPFVSSTARDTNMNPIVNVTRENIGVTLRITPQVSSRDEVTLKIEEDVQELLEGQNPSIIQTQGPSTSKRNAKTTVVVKDRQSVVIGGLIGDRETKTVSKVPILGDIPLLGFFFRNTGKSKQKTNLILIATPYIIETPEDMGKIFLEKTKQRELFLEKHGMEQNKKLEDMGIKLTPLPEPKPRRERAENFEPAKPFPESLPPAPVEEKPEDVIEKDEKSDTEDSGEVKQKQEETQEGVKQETPEEKIPAETTPEEKREERSTIITPEERAQERQPEDQIGPKDESKEPPSENDQPSEKNEDNEWEKFE